MSEALTVVRNALGDTWLRRACEQPNTAEIPFRRHHIGDCLTVPGDEAVVELVELALYLRRLHAVPGLIDVLDVLRKDYWTARQQLAFAHRFRELGAENLQFEPAVGTKRGDLKFLLDGRLFVVESFYPRYGRGTSPSLLRFFKRAAAIGDAVGDLTSRTLRVTIRLVRTPNHSDAKALENWIYRLARDAVQRLEIAASRELGAPVKVSEQTSDLATITIEDITGVVPDPDFGAGSPMRVEPRILLVLMARRISVETALRLRDGPLGVDDGKRGTRIRLIDAAMNDVTLTPRQVAEALVTKLQRKVSQVGDLPADASRLLLVNVPWLDDPTNSASVSRARTILQHVHDKIILGRSRMAGVLAVTRVWTGKRHQYRGLLLEGEAGAGLAALVEEGLNRLEGEGDLLEKW